MNRIYLDHASTTPVIAEARAAFTEALDCWSNPNSPHREGRECRARLEAARDEMKAVLGSGDDLVFTSGASEAVEIAARRAKVAGRAHGSTEHAIVPFAMGEESTIIPVGRNGLIDEAALETILASGPTLVAIQHVNNETGIIQPLDRLAPKIREAGSLLLADCAQSASKLPLPDADFIAICGHKLGGPPGVGALLVKDLAMLEPCGGGQEQGYRRGTQDVPGAVSFAAALSAQPYDMERLAGLRAGLEDGVEALGGLVIAKDAPRSPAIGAISLPGATSMAMLVQLDLAGIAVSAGSACSSGTTKASHVLEAMNVEPEIGSAFLRVSFGPDTREDEIVTFLSEFGRLAERRPRAA